MKIFLSHGWTRKNEETRGEGDARRFPSDEIGSVAWRFAWRRAGSQREPAHHGVELVALRPTPSPRESARGRNIPRPNTSYTPRACWRRRTQSQRDCVHPLHHPLPDKPSNGGVRCTAMNSARVAGGADHGAARCISLNPPRSACDPINFGSRIESSPIPNRISSAFN